MHGETLNLEVSRTMFEIVNIMRIRIAKLPSIHLAYRSEGRGDPPIIMLHGFGATSLVWKEQFGVVSKRHRLVAPDLRGWGYSDKPSGSHYAIQDHVRDIQSLAEHLGFQKFVLIGSSMGGSIALQYCLAYPDLVSALVLVGARPRARPDLRELISRARNGGQRDIVLDTVHQSLAGNSAAKTQQLARSALRVSQDAVVYGLEDFQGFDVTKDLHKITVPTLIIFGEHDAIMGLNEGDLIHKRIKGSLFRVVPSSGHLPMWESPKYFNRLLQEFLE